MGEKITELYKKVLSNQGKTHVCLTEKEFMEAMEKDNPELLKYKRTAEQQEYMEALDTMLRHFNPTWKDGNLWWIYFNNETGKKLTVQDVHDYFSNLIGEYNKYADMFEKNKQ